MGRLCGVLSVCIFVFLTLVLAGCSGGSKETTSGTTSGTTAQTPPPDNPPPSNPPPANPPPSNPPPGNPPPVVKHGVVKGGIVPVSGATIQLYALGSSDGGPSTPLIGSPLLSDSSGEFDLAGMYTCPSPDALVYLVARGGDPGTGATNPQLSMMTVLGSCGDITATTDVTVNEITTVAAVWSLAPFMRAADTVGANVDNDAALAAAFRTAILLVNPASGTIPGPSAPKDATLPTAQINTLADILAACVQSQGGAAGDGSVCGKLFAYTTESGQNPPSTVIAAMLSLANNPAQHAADLFALLPSPLPFGPVLASAPSSFALPTTFPSGLLVTPAAVSFDAEMVGDTASKTITLTNQGSAPIQLTSIGISASSMAEFSYSLSSPQSPCSFTISLAGGTKCTITVGLSPVSAGQKLTDLQITSTAPNGLIHIPLSGEAQDVASGSLSFAVTPDSLTFSTIGVPQTITVTNTGTVPMTLLITPYFPPASYSQSSTPDGQGWGENDTCTQASIAPSASCTITAQIYGIGGPSNGIPSWLTLEAHAGADEVSQLVGIRVTSDSGVQLFAKPLDFGGWPVHVASLPKKITLSSPLGVALVNRGISGLNHSDFTADCISVVGTCTVIFTPGALGARTATLQTQYGDIALSGSGQADGPSIAVMPIFFTTATLGSYGTAGFEVVNNGTQPVAPEITLVPPTDPALFTIQYNAGSECPSTLAPKDSCQPYVKFTPNQIGDKPASLQVKDKDSGFTVVKSFTESASAAPTGLQFGINPLDVRPVGLNSTSSNAVYLNNQDVFTVAPAAGGNASGDFSVALSSTCKPGTSGSNSGSCFVTVTFTPSALGLRTTSFVITDETTGKTGTLLVQGTGANQMLQASPGSLAFPDTEAGSSSAAQLITVKNNGDIVGNFTPSIAGSNAASFAVDQGTCNGGSNSSLAPGNSCTLEIIFRPVAQGQANARLQLSGTNISIPLSGAGTAPLTPSPVGLSATSLSFPDETVSYSTDPQGVTITNTGQDAEDVTVQVLDGSGQVLNVTGDFVLQNEDRCLGLQAGRSCRVSVRFQPLAAGARSGTLRILSLPSGRVATVSLSGTGLEPSGGPLTLSPADGLFFGQTGIPQTVTVTNSGDTAVAIKYINYENNDCPAMLQGHASCTIAVDGLYGAPLVWATSSATAYTLPVSLPPGAVTSYATSIPFGPVPVSTRKDGYYSSYTSAPQQQSSIVGENADEFSVQTCSALEQYGECDISLSFTPQQSGLRQALMETPTGGVKLYGVGGAGDGADFTITQNYFSASIVPGYVGTITVTNTGTAPLLLSRVKPNPNVQPNFGLTPVGAFGAIPGVKCNTNQMIQTLTTSSTVGSTDSGISIAVGGSCTFEISFDMDQNNGVKSEDITFVDRISDVSRSITLNGDAGAGVSAPTVSQSQIDVGNIAVGSSSAPKTVTINAPSGDPVTASVSTTNSPTYVLDTGSCATATPCQMTLKVTPTMPGRFYTYVAVVDPRTGKSISWSVTGVGGFPVPQFYPTSLDFGTEAIFHTSTAQSLRVTNVGETDLNITNFTLSGTGKTDYVVDGSNCIGRPVGVGKSCTVGVSFHPYSIGSRPATLNVVSNAQTAIPGVLLSGTGQ